MRGLFFRLVVILMMGAKLVQANPSALTATEAIQNIAKDIEDLKKEFLVLADFDAERDTNIRTLSIDHAYNTKRSEVKAGWRAGVPSPKENGIWFHIDFHDAGSTAQLHTQPISAPRFCYGNKILSILILQGANTKPVRKSIIEILKRNGVRDCTE